MSEINLPEYNETDADKSARLLRYIMPDVSIELKIKPRGTHNEYSIRKDLQYVIGDKNVLNILKAVLNEEKRNMVKREDRMVKIVEEKMPPCIKDHLRKLITRYKRKIGYIEQVIEALESPNRKTPSYMPPMKRYANECEDIEDEE